MLTHTLKYTCTHQDTEREVSSYLSRKLSGRLAGIDMVDKEDLDLLNHLVGLKGRYLKLRFHSVEDLIKAKRDILPAVRKNREREKARSAYDPTLFTTRSVRKVLPIEVQSQCLGNFTKCSKIMHSWVIFCQEYIPDYSNKYSYA